MIGNSRQGRRCLSTQPFLFERSFTHRHVASSQHEIRKCIQIKIKMVFKKKLSFFLIFPFKSALEGKMDRTSKRKSRVIRGLCIRVSRCTKVIQPPGATTWKRRRTNEEEEDEEEAETTSAPYRKPCDVGYFQNVFSIPDAMEIDC